MLSDVLSDLRRELGVERDRRRLTAVCRAANISLSAAQKILSGQQHNPTISTVDALQAGIAAVRKAAAVNGATHA